jgi:hypothetical protein
MNYLPRHWLEMGCQLHVPATLPHLTHWNTRDLSTNVPARLLQPEGASGSPVGSGAMTQTNRPRVRFLTRSFDFSVDLTLPAALAPGVDPASNRNEYQPGLAGE